MTIKLFEIRDRATFIPALAVRLASNSAEEFYLLRRAGFSAESLSDSAEEPYVLLWTLDGVDANYDPFQWPNFRTLGNAHKYIIEHWSELTSGDVIDVEFILGESTTKKESEFANRHA